MARHGSLVRRALAAGLAAACLAASACSSSGDAPSARPNELLIAINAPFSVSPYVGQTIEQGVQLAVDEIAAAGGVALPNGSITFRTKRYDNGLSASKAADNVRAAIADGAVAIVDEGTGVDATWQMANEAGVPIGIVYQGGMGLVDAETRPNVFRIAPTDHGVAFRLAEYLIPKGLSIALLADDTDYGVQGTKAFDVAFGFNPEAVAAKIVVPASAGDVAPQVLQARQAGATALVVWAHAATVAKVLRAARTSGWDVPVYTAPSGQDPLVRQQLSDHPEWVDGLTFASGRMTAEKGPEPFLAFQQAYEDAFGPDDVGVTTSGGDEVFQPPEFAMYPYDFVKVLAAALQASAGQTGAPLLDLLNQVDVQGANGDERGFNEKNHEGVVDDDVCFAVFHDMTFLPVQDDPLSSTLDPIPQTR
jgi:branched-chain amino acid transport system substrate-binding protein